MSRRGSLRVLLWAMLLTLVPVSRAAAQARTANETPDTSPARASAKERFDRGMALSRQGEWERALEEFLESRRLFPLAANALNAAICLKQLKRSGEAFDYFKAYRTYPLNDAEAAAVDRELEALEKVIATLVITATEPGAKIMVDENDVSDRAGQVHVSRGPHVLRAIREGFETAVEFVDVGPRDTLTKRLVLRPLEQAGRIQVHASNDATAKVFVDGNVVGETPWERRRGRAGLRPVITRSSSASTMVEARSPRKPSCTSTG